MALQHDDHLNCWLLRVCAASLLSMVMQTVSAAAELDLDLEPWRTVNDGVMGGASQGQMVAIDNGLRFQGHLSLENNGGFASARRSYDGNLTGASGIGLRVKGDGRRYQFRVRLDDRYDGISWSAEFGTSESWQTVNLPFGTFVPVFRGRHVDDAGPFVPGDISQLGFLIADGKEGRFQLDIASIEFPEGE